MNGIDYLIDRLHTLRNLDRSPSMDTVTLSPKFQVVIPQTVREALELRPGEKFHVVSYDGRIELIPVRRMKKTRGFLKGMDPAIKRSQADRAL